METKDMGAVFAAVVAELQKVPDEEKGRILSACWVFFGLKDNR